LLCRLCRKGGKPRLRFGFVSHIQLAGGHRAGPGLMAERLPGHQTPVRRRSRSAVPAHR
jgi:hypothetical protein